MTKKHQRMISGLLNHQRRDLCNTAVHIIAGVAASELLVVMRFSIVAIAIMKQRIILVSIRSIDMTFHGIKSDRSYVHFVGLSKRSSKSVLTVVYAWENTSVRLASYLTMTHLRCSIIAMAVAFAGLEGARTSSTATSVVAATRFC